MGSQTCAVSVAAVTTNPDGSNFYFLLLCCWCSRSRWCCYCCSGCTMAKRRIHQDKKFFISELFKVIQDAILLILLYRTMYEFRTIFFEYIYHVGCAINLQSIVNSGLIPGGQILSKRQTVFFTSVDPMNKEHKDPDVINLDAPRLAWYTQKTWKKHPNTVYWVDIQLAQRTGLKLHQTRSNAIILYDTLPAYCIPKAIMETGETTHGKVYASPRPPPKIPFKDNWMKELGSEVAGGGKDSQQTQPKIQLLEQ